METSNFASRSTLRRVADRMTDWRFHCWYWGDAIGVDGLLAAAALGADIYRAHVVETLQRWHERCPPNFDDALAPGAAIIQLVMDGDLAPAAGERVLRQLEALPRACGEMPALEPHRPLFRFGLCIDGDDRFADKAKGIALDGMRALRCGAGWAQWFDPTRRRNNDVAWSRGMGWAVLGLLDLAHRLDGRGTGEITDLAGQVMERLAQTQQADGNWAAVLDHAASDTETSTAAFYVAAALHPAAQGLLSLPAEALQRAAAACHRALAEDGTYTGATADVLPSWDVKTYEHCPIEPSPWAQGAAVRAFAALVQADDSRP
jgi:unsaturated rhamnogalacturonyl hydrolase